jgi:hypothetical protein
LKAVGDFGKAVFNGDTGHVCARGGAISWWVKEFAVG